jgi:hypothetical protein
VDEDKSGTKQNEAVIQKFQAGVKQAMAQVEQKRAELEKAERALQEAVARLQKVGGGKYVPITVSKVRVQERAPVTVSGALIKAGEPVEVEFVNPKIVTVPGPDVKYETVIKALTGPDLKGGKAVIIRSQDDKAAIGKWVVANPGQRVDDLERKLDKLMKEVEMLRRDLQKSRGQSGAGEKE